MSADLQAGVTFEWRYTIPERVTVQNLYHDTAFCREMPDVLASGYMVILPERFNARLAQKKVRIAA